jgi:hypothetical protein
VTTNGPTEIEALSEQVNPQTLNSHIPTEMVLMQLTGNPGPPFGPITVRAGRNALLPGLQRTHGDIIGGAPGLFYPADSFFDVFFQIDIPALGLQVRNRDPFRMQTSIPEIPPLGTPYLNVDNVDLFDQFNNPFGQLFFGRHVPVCQNDAQCDDDGNPCTKDVCQIASGQCQHLPQPDSDGDGLCDDADNCPQLPNLGGQSPFVFGQTIIAQNNKQNYCWPLAASVDWLQGDLALVSTYAFSSITPLNAACFVDATTPAADQGRYYIVRHGCPGGSWQTTLGAETGRDDTLP